MSVSPWKVDENGERESRAVAIKMDDCEVSEERSTEVKPTVPRKHGYSAGCPGCASMLRKDKNRKMHSDACRRRMEELLRNTDSVKAAGDRINDYLAKMLEGADEERKSKKAKTETHLMPEDSQDMTMGEDLEHDGHEGVGASSRWTEEER